MATKEPIRSAEADYEIELALRELIAGAYRATMFGNAHVFMNFSGHIQSVEIYAIPTNSRYEPGARPRERLMEKTIYLDDDARTVMDRITAALDAIDSLGDTK